VLALAPTVKAVRIAIESRIAALARRRGEMRVIGAT